jgi:competence protein ComEC
VDLRRRPYHVGLAAFAGGLGCCGTPLLAAALATLVVGIGLAALRALELGVLAAALFVAGALLGAARLHAIDAPQLSLHAGAPLTARAYLLERPRFSPFGSSAEVQLASGAARGAHVLARANGSLIWPDGGREGVELDLAGTLELPKRSAGSSFDYPAYLRRRGIRFELALDRLRPTGRRRGGVAGMVDSLRGRAERGVAAGLSDGNDHLLAGVVLGEDQLISEDVRDDFRRSGLGHLLS